jgi:hypothetical protein
MKSIKHLLLVSFLTMLVSCLSDGGIKTTRDLEPSGSDLRILATDAPFNFGSVTSAKVTLSRIDMIEERSGAVTAVMNEEVTLDLINLKNGLVQSLAEVHLPRGSYGELRLIVTSASVTLSDGRFFNLVVPSGAQSGLKVFVTPAIQVTGRTSTDLLLDFDLSRSFVPRGSDNGSDQGIQGFHFKPVLRASNLTTSGTITGKVMSDSETPLDISDDTSLEGAVVKVMKDGVVIATAVTEASGVFKILGLPEGSYAVVTEMEGHEVQDAVSVGVNAGNETEENFLLTLIPQIIDDTTTETGTTEPDTTVF